jgi:ribonuclease HI/probable phosphoglycerate mutase
VDGSSLGNPGPSGAGIVLTVGGETLLERSEDVGYGTNNQAEYRALIEGLAEALQRGVRTLLVRSDSQLLVRQMIGEYKLKARGLRGLKAEADALRERFDEVRFEHIEREANPRADELAKAGAEAAQARGVRPPQREMFE